MKKAFVLALMLVMVMSVGVFAQVTRPPIIKDDPNEGQIHIELTVQPYAQVFVPTKELKFKVAGNGSISDRTVDVKVKSNSPIFVNVVSKGFHRGNAEANDLNEMVTYMLGALKEPGFSIGFKAGSEWGETFKAGGIDESYSIGFRLNYRPGNDWHEILAGTYTDTIEWTVTAVN